MSEFTIHNERILEGRKFRLLFILPSSNPHQRVECYCFPFELDTAPEYEALSYVWGNQNAQTEIIFNGRLVEVGAELSHALLRLRLQFSTRLVWADALCINQQDNEEKGHQVPLMGSIYSLARRVVVWLGHEDPDVVTEAMQSVKYIAEACVQYRTGRDFDPESDQRFRALELPAEMFGPADAIVLYGDQEIPWSALGLAASWIFDKTTVGTAHDALTSSLQRINSANADLMYDEELAQEQLISLLPFFREFQATDPRDKVYGLLNLVKNRREVEALNVDYNKSVGQVFADTTLIMIRLYSSLNTLAFVFHPEDYDGDDQVRSWAPAWNEDSTADIGFPESLCPWSACGCREAKIADETRLGYEQLPLTGIFYDTVTTITGIMDYTNLKKDPRSNSRHPFINVLHTLTDSPGLDHAELIPKLARTLGAGQFANGVYIHDADEHIQHDFYVRFFSILEFLLDPSSRNKDAFKKLDSESSTFLIHACHMCRQRRVFLTQGGSYGLGPQCMRVGDIVTVLYGGHTPCVLRPRGNKYLFMGLAYVDDIMQGELVKEVDAGERIEQEFCII